MENLMNILITPAFAETAGAPGAQGGGLSLMMMLVIFVIFIYFGIWRPQSKRAKEQQTLLNTLAKGDEVITAGGILGKINKLTDQYIELTVANNTEIVMQKSSIVTILPKGTIKSLGSA